jgi:HPt (histidine-containing phosphotransfer) domain-containing protein
MPTDEQMKDKANEIITKLTDKNPSDKQSIDAQKKANEKAFGHQGEYDPSNH